MLEFSLMRDLFIFNTVFTVSAGVPTQKHTKLTELLQALAHSFKCIKVSNKTGQKPRLKLFPSS